MVISYLYLLCFYQFFYKYCINMPDLLIFYLQSFTIFILVFISFQNRFCQQTYRKKQTLHGGIFTYFSIIFYKNCILCVHLAPSSTFSKSNSKSKKIFSFHSSPLLRPLQIKNTLK